MFAIDRFVCIPHTKLSNDCEDTGSTEADFVFYHTPNIISPPPVDSSHSNNIANSKQLELQVAEVVELEYFCLMLNRKAVQSR